MDQYHCKCCHCDGTGCANCEFSGWYNMGGCPRSFALVEVAADAPPEDREHVLAMAREAAEGP